jgi:hypothetical protein
MSSSAELKPTFSLFAKPRGQMAKLQSPSSSNRILLRQSKGHTQSISTKHPTSKQRRQESWRDWAVGTGGEDFQCIDFPQIAREYSSVWSNTISEQNNLRN